MRFNPAPRARLLMLAAAAVATNGCKESVGPDKRVEFVEVSPQAATMYVVGAQQEFSAAITTEAGTPGTGIEVGWISRNPALVKVNSAGVATVESKGGSTWLVATAGGVSDSARVDVPATPCANVGTTAMTVGQVVTGIGAEGFCADDIADAEYSAIILNQSLASSATASIEVVGIALGDPPTLKGPSLASRAGFMRPTGLRTTSRWRRNIAAETEQRETERKLLSPLVAGAQAWYRQRSQGPLRAAAVPAVGDLVPVNVSQGLTCNSILTRNARVKAVSNFAIMLEDVNNPAGGFTDAEYASLAQTFDTLVHVVDVEAFGAPTDLDGNGRVNILFTREINALTPAGSDSYVGGRTISRDLHPKTGTGSSTTPQGCAASNTAEMFYMLVPDPSGVVNGNKFDKDFVLGQTLSTIGHEYQHLINFSRRMYLLGLSSDKWFDETWLHEGLSHMAEELLFYRSSRLASRSNISLPQILSSDAVIDAFNEFMIGNFFLYDAYAADARNTSPMRPVDLVSTRGATWSFFRYLADQTRPTDDGTLWSSLVNSSLIGQANLQAQLGVNAAGLQGLLRDFVVSVYSDDYVTGIPAKYRQPSWNMRPIYRGFCEDPNVSCGFEFPLPSDMLDDNTPRGTTLVAGGFAVFRFKPVSGAEALVRVTGASGTAMPSNITMSVVRTK